MAGIYNSSAANLPMPYRHFGGGGGGGITSARGGFRQAGEAAAGQAANIYGMQRPNSKTTQEPPGKTAGGAMMAGLGGAAAGASIGAAYGTTTAGPGYGTAIGAVVGLVAYMMS